jgi:hypothetical protein
MWKTSPTTGIAPIVDSRRICAAMRARVILATPRRHAANTIRQDAMPAVASPIPGTWPIKSSGPNRILVPGILHISSSAAMSRSLDVSKRAQHWTSYRNTMQAQTSGRDSLVSWRESTNVHFVEAEALQHAGDRAACVVSGVFQDAVLQGSL